MTDLPLEKLSRLMDYQFSDPSLLERALCHRSFTANSNERLEFLGDAILNFIIAEQIYQKFPRLSEGELSRIRASLVCGETLAVIAKQLALSEFIRLGMGELKSGGAYRESILADTLEAVIGAIYLDSNFETCKQTILPWFQTRLNAPDIIEAEKDPKTQLQEYLQQRQCALPEYVVVLTEGEAHAKTFHVECRIKALSIVTTGQGRSRRVAEQIAAQQALVLLASDHE